MNGLRTRGPRGDRLLFRLPGPPAGGLAGLAKTAGQEWPEVKSKAIDIEAALDDPEGTAAAIVEEIFLSGPVEVGITSTERWTPQLSRVPTAEGPATSPLAEGDVVVVTGGARGITAECTLALGRAFQPTLVVLGRSPDPHPEPAWLSSLAEESAIKSALREHGAGSTPRELGREYALRMNNREILRNIERLESTGARVIYSSVDVRDANAVSTLMESIRERVGPIHGLIHGAGVIADRRIEEKSKEEFERVYDTKVRGFEAVHGLAIILALPTSPALQLNAPECFRSVFHPQSARSSDPSSRTCYRS